MDELFLSRLELFCKLVRDCKYSFFLSCALDWFWLWTDLNVFLSQTDLCVLVCFYDSKWLILFFSDVTSFTRSLSGKQDAGFFLYGEVCKYIRKLCCRSILSSSIPAEDKWDDIFGLDLASAPLVLSRVFLKKLGMEARVALASKIKAENEVCDKSSKANIALLTEQLIVTTLDICFLALTVTLELALSLWVG